MHRPPRLLSCLLVAVAILVSGCGSSKKTGASSVAGQSASTGASGNSGAQTVPRGASNKESQHAQKAVKPKTAEAKPEQKTDAEAEATRRILHNKQANEHAAARIGLQAAEADLPLKRRYPKELQGKFMRACKAAKGSTTSSCECIIVRQEANLKVERGQTLAELLAVEIAFEREHATLEDIRRHRVRSPRLVRRVVRACR